MQPVADLLTAVIAALRGLAVAWWPSVVAAAVVLAAGRMRSGSRPRLVAPRSGAWGYWIVGAIAFLAAAVRTVIAGEPRPPWYFDDYGYLLISDTFLHGRLANPPHPMHAYFETLYVLQSPHYAAVYAPLQPALLALARLLAGAPVVGLWVASAAAACGIAWSVAAIAPIELAFAAGLLCAIHPTVIGWTSMRPGDLAAAGGALAIGGALRMPARGAILAMAAGFAVLANTRPFEGLVIACIAAAFAIREWRALAAVVGLTCLFLCGTAVYNAAVTGDPFVTPYDAYNAKMLSAPNFLWQKPLPPRTYPNFEMEHTYAMFRRYYERSRHLGDLAVSVRERIDEMWSTAIPTGGSRWLNGLRLFAALPIVFGLRRQWRLWIGLVVFAVAILQITWWPQTHYLAPAAALFAVAYAAGAARMFESGHALLAQACIGVIFILAAKAYTDTFTVRWPPSPRTAAVASLQPRAGRQLVLADERCLNVVFNGAAIDRQKIVFARSLGDVAPLLAYYPDREVWRLTCTPYSLVPVRPALIAAGTGGERDLFYPWHFPGRLRQSLP